MRATPQRQESENRACAHATAPGNLSFRDTLCHPPFYLHLAPRQFIPLVSAPVPPPQLDTHRPPARQRLFCPLAYQVSLNLRAQAECESQNLALNVITQSVAVLYCPHPAIFRHADIQNLHYHEQIAPQPRQLSADYDVASRHVVYQRPQPSLVISLNPAYRLLYPSVNGQPLALGEPQHLIPLIFHGLFVTAYSYVPVYHSVFAFFSVSTLSEWGWVSDFRCSVEETLKSKTYFNFVIF